MRLVIRGDFVHTPRLDELEILHDYLLGVDTNGFVAHFSPAASPESSIVLSNNACSNVPPGSFLLPTYTDLHLHAPQFLYQGTGLDLPLMEWLDKYTYVSEERLDADPRLARRVYERLAERLAQNGTGAVLCFGTIKSETNLILADVMQRQGLRGHIGKLSMDISSRPSYVEPSSTASLSAISAFIDDCRALMDGLPPHERLVHPVVTPRFVPTCSDELLEGLGKLAREKNVQIQSHMCEARDQVEWVERERGIEDMEVFARSNLLTKATIQAHCTYLTHGALSNLAIQGVSIAHCPLSNAYFSHKPFALREALDAGIKVGLGSDIAGGYALDVGQAMRSAVVVSRMRDGQSKEAAVEAGIRSKEDTGGVEVGWKEALFIATLGGAKALDLPEGAGMFAIGAPFDAQLLNLWDPNTKRGVGNLDFFDVEEGGSERLNEEVLEKWWCNGDIRNREAVWVQGREVYCRT